MALTGVPRAAAPPATPQAATVAHDHPATLGPLFATALDRFGDRPALITQAGTTTYAQLVTAANALASTLSFLGAGAGVPVALMLGNCVEYVIADQAILRCGAVKVPLNTMLSPPEVGEILRDSDVHIVITGSGMLPSALAADSASLKHVIHVGDQTSQTTDLIAWENAVAGEGQDLPPTAAGPDDLGLILYTGGTTGRSKGVMHTQRGLIANLWSHIIEMGLLDDERLLLTSPLPHSAGFLLQAALMRGAVVHLESGFDPEVVLRRIVEDRVTYTFMVPTMIYRVLDAAEGRDLDLTSLRTILYGAAPITTERLSQGLERLGPVFMQLYAQSEAPNFLTRLRREDHRLDPDAVHRLASCGQAVAMAQVQVVDPRGVAVPRGEVGEVVARAPYVMCGYLGLPEQTAAALAGGWLHTGDLGRIDADGYVFLVDRMKDMIISGGMNVYCTEVENAIADVGGVGQVAVVGVAHADWGEAVVAFVVAPEQSTTTDVDGLADAVRARCKQILSAYKQPKAVEVVPHLPLTVYGKVDKAALRARWRGW